jgi:hypothetical protein
MSKKLESETPVAAATACSPGGRCRDAYREECSMRWSGDALRNARGNWETFEEHHADIVAVLEPYLRDSGCRDIAGNYHNPDHTLTGWLWKCSEAKENWWIWDFCEHYQKCHLRRGIIQYCKQVIVEIKAAQDPAPGHPEITLDFNTPAWSPAKYVRINGETMTAEEWERRRSANIPLANSLLGDSWGL